MPVETYHRNFRNLCKSYGAGVRKFFFALPRAEKRYQGKSHFFALFKGIRDFSILPSNLNRIRIILFSCNKMPHFFIFINTRHTRRAEGRAFASADFSTMPVSSSHFENLTMTPRAAGASCFATTSDSRSPVGKSALWRNPFFLTAITMSIGLKLVSHPKQRARFPEFSLKRKVFSDTHGKRARHADRRVKAGYFFHFCFLAG